MKDNFVFFPASGEHLHFDLMGVPGLTGRMSRSGRRVMIFPEPFADVEITEGERVGHLKLARIRTAAEALRAAAAESK